MEVNKIVIENTNQQVVSIPIDLTEDTATEDKVLEGYTFHKADGTRAVGTATGGSSNYVQEFLQSGGTFAWYRGEMPDFSTIDISARDNLRFLFSGAEFGTGRYTLDLTSLDTSGATNMGSMFKECRRASQIVFGGLFNTSNVTNMSSMFEDCIRLSTLNLTPLDTSNVTSMSRMFKQCNIGDGTLDFSNFNTSKVTNMDEMFAGINGFDSTTLDLSDLDTSSATSMISMFEGCNTQSLNILSFDTSLVNDMTRMFYGCGNLTSLDLSNFTTTSIGTSGGREQTEMFAGCYNLQSLDIRQFDYQFGSEGMFRDIQSNCVIYVNQSFYNVLADNYNNGGNTIELADLNMLSIVS